MYVVYVFKDYIICKMMKVQKKKIKIIHKITKNYVLCVYILILTDEIIFYYYLLCNIIFELNNINHN